MCVMKKILGLAVMSTREFGGWRHEAEVAAKLSEENEGLRTIIALQKQTIEKQNEYIKMAVKHENQRAMCP